MKKNDGIALFEVLISMSLLGFVLCSLFIYQINNLKLINHIYLETISVIQLENFAEELRSNSSSSFRESALLDWNNDNLALLPQATGELNMISDHVCDIKINWIEKTWQTNSIEIIC